MNAQPGTMRIAVLGATGALGGNLVAQALDRGHSVVALVRDPGRFSAPASSSLAVVTAAMLDEAERPLYAGQTAVPVS